MSLMEIGTRHQRNLANGSNALSVLRPGDIISIRYEHPLFGTVTQRCKIYALDELAAVLETESGSSHAVPLATLFENIVVAHPPPQQKTAWKMFLHMAGFD